MKNEKKYLTRIDSTHGATLEILYNPDDAAKPFYIGYGSYTRGARCLTFTASTRDTGKRYVKIGAAARYLENVARRQWGADTVKTYATPADVK